MTPEIQSKIDQIRHGIVPEGYQKSIVGTVPSNWTTLRMGECLERVERPVTVEASKMYTQIGIRSHGKGLFYKEPVSGTDLGNKAVYWVEPDCFVLNIVFAWEQAIGKTTANEVGMIGSHRFPMYRPFCDKIDIDYLIAYLMTKRGKELLETASPGGAGRNRTLGQVHFLRSRIVLPPVAEQHKIAAILTTQDKVIALKEQLLAQKLEQKKYLMQQLLTGKKRLSGCQEPWRKTNLSDILHEHGEINTDQTLRICSVSVQKGVVDQVEHLGRSYAAECTSNYKVVHYGDIVYTKSPTGDFPFGIIKQSQFSETVAVSPLYGVFTPCSYSMGYLLHTYFSFESNCTNYLLPIIHKGAKNTINITNSVFISKQLYLPVNEDEQEKLTQIFVTADKELALLRQSIEQEKQKKKALMQLLLTGIVRV